MVNILGPACKFFVAVLLLVAQPNFAFGQDTTPISNPVSSKENSLEEYEDEEDFEGPDAVAVSDPFEKVNRKIFNFNEVVDKYFVEHVARGYRNYIPEGTRRSIRNFFDNLYLPFVTLNSALQGKSENTMSSFSTFLINSTIGIGGLFDVAGKKGISYQEEDFGQTFAKYNIGQGPYLILPLYGPSNLRDLTGLVTENAVNPLSYNALKIGGRRELLEDNIIFGKTAISGIDQREELLDIVDNIRKDSFDPYVTIRSAYTQRRNFQISN